MSDGEALSMEGVRGLVGVGSMVTGGSTGRGRALFCMILVGNAGLIEWKAG